MLPAARLTRQPAVGVRFDVFPPAAAQQLGGTVGCTMLLCASIQALYGMQGLGAVEFAVTRFDAATGEGALDARPE